jgi:hypothetical protein
MPTNPCRSCALVHADKNNATCMRCEKRLQYVQQLDRHLGSGPSRRQTEGPVFYRILFPDLPYPRICS